jgi:hypothetical protein
MVARPVSAIDARRGVGQGFGLGAEWLAQLHRSACAPFTGTRKVAG